MRNQEQTSQLPSSIHAENAVIGAMLFDALAVQDALAALSPDDFVLDSHQKIFRRLASMSSEGKHIDLLTVAQVLAAHGELDAVGGPEYLLSLSDGLPRNPSIKGYARMLQDRTLARKGIQACTSAQQRLLGQSEPAAEVLDDLSKSLIQDRPDDSRPIAAVLPRAIQALEPGSNTRISTGIPELDEMTRGGGRTKELWVIGAQPSAGKSALCRQLERSAVSHGHGIHAHSIEVDDVSWIQFHMANVAGVSPWKLREPEEISERDKKRLIQAAISMDGWPYIVDDAGSVHINTLLAKSRLSVMRHGTRVVTVDYLQMLSGDEKNLKELMGKTAKRLKQFAKDNDCWVIALSQLSRQGDINAKPTVQHLKESGDIEAAADVIILNYRPKNPDDGRYTGEDELIVGKQRNGTVGAIDMYFDPETLTFVSRSDRR